MVKKILVRVQKEAFVLFEGLLAKIKNDVIKLLLNLNIMVSSKMSKKKKEVAKAKT